MPVEHSLIMICPAAQSSTEARIPLNTTEGKPGEYFRAYLHPNFSPVLGYTSPYYGQAGAESSLDTIFRGIENNSPFTVWFNHLLYGQSPPGLTPKPA